jgi:hypothetical protein
MEERKGKKQRKGPQRVLYFFAFFAWTGFNDMLQN